jgi:hypothetical protein
VGRFGSADDEAADRLAQLAEQGCGIKAVRPGNDLHDVDRWLGVGPVRCGDRFVEGADQDP